MARARIHILHISERGGGAQSGRHRRSGDPSRRGAEGKLELTEGATAQSRLKEFQKGSAEYPAWLTANYPLGYHDDQNYGHIDSRGRSWLKYCRYQK